MDAIANISWVAVIASVVAGQVLSTMWFTVLFGDPWATEYGAASRQQHTAEIPPTTYGVQLLCTIALTVSLAVLQQMVGVTSIGEGIGLGAFVAIGFMAATMIPGQAFLKRWGALAIAGGSQAAMILVISGILAALS